MKGIGRLSLLKRLKTSHAEAPAQARETRALEAMERWVCVCGGGASKAETPRLRTWSLIFRERGREREREGEKHPSVVSFVPRPGPGPNAQPRHVP